MAGRSVELVLHARIGKPETYVLGALLGTSRVKKKNKISAGWRAHLTIWIWLICSWLPEDDDEESDAYASCMVLHATTARPLPAQTPSSARVPACPAAAVRRRATRRQHAAATCPSSGGGAFGLRQHWTRTYHHTRYFVPSTDRRQIRSCGSGRY